LTLDNGNTCIYLQILLNPLNVIGDTVSYEGTVVSNKLSEFVSVGVKTLEFIRDTSFKGGDGNWRYTIPTDTQIQYNTDSTYFISRIHADGSINDTNSPCDLDDNGECAYALFYNPVHRCNFRKFYNEEYAEAGSGTANPKRFTDVFNNYCLNTSYPEYDGNASSTSKFGDPTCGCAMSWEIPAPTVGGTKETTTFNKYTADSLNIKSISANATWPNKPSNYSKSSVNALVGDPNSDLIKYAGCKAPACNSLILAPTGEGTENDSRSFIQDYRDNVTPGSCDFEKIEINQCNAINDAAGDVIMSETDYILRCGGTGVEKELDCNKGFASETGKSPGCTECPPNTYQDSTGEMECINCPDGEYTDGKTGQSTCVPIPVVIVDDDDDDDIVDDIVDEDDDVIIEDDVVDDVGGMSKKQKLILFILLGILIIVVVGSVIFFLVKK
jgi:hypothetical protein